MGLSSKKQKTTTQSTFNNTSTSTPDVPDWIRQPYERAAGQVGALQGADPMSFAPQSSDLSSLAYSRAAGRSTSPLYEEAAGMARGDYSPGSVDASFTGPKVGTQFGFDGGTVKGESLLDGLDNYYTPFRDKVLNPVLDDFDETAGKVRAAQAANGAKNQAFRGTRFAIREGETEGQLARGRAATEGGLLNDMFNTATSLSSQDAARRQAAAEGNVSRGLQADLEGARMGQTGELANAGYESEARGRRLSAETTNAGLRDQALGRKLQGAGLLSDIGNQRGVSERADIALQGQLGSEKTALENARRTAPLDVQKQLQGLLAGLNPALFTGETSTGTGTSNGSSDTKSSQSLLAALGGLLGNVGVNVNLGNK